MQEHTTHDPAQEIPYGYCHCGCGQKTRIAPKTSRAKGWIKGQPIRFVVGHSNGRSVVLRFWEKVDCSGGPDACWLWQGTICGKYGQISHEGKGVYAHRMSYLLNVGPIPDRMFVCHNCPDGDQPLCCNPKHLWLGTHEENMADMVDKGRSAPQAGSQNHLTKLTEADVTNIRRLATQGMRHLDIADRYHVNRATISYIVSGKTWKHVSDSHSQLPP